jgi:hypothetical protein
MKRTHLPVLLALITSIPGLLQAQNTYSTIFDDDPASSVYRDASFGTASGGDYLRRVGDKFPLDASRAYHGTMCGILEYAHLLNGQWEMFIASDAWQTRDFSGYDSLIFYINSPGQIPASEMPRLGLESSNGNAKTPLVDLSTYVTLDGDSTTWQQVSIPFTAFEPFGNFTLSAFKTVRFKENGATTATRRIWVDYVCALKMGSLPPPPPLTDEQLLDSLQYRAFRFFWEEANPSNGLIKDRSTPSSPASIAAVGFGLTAIGVAVDHGWINREAGRDRTLTTLRTFWEMPQGSSVSGVIGYKGWFYHFLDMNTATRVYTVSWKSELSSIDTGLLLAGILYAREYYTGADSVETSIRSLADSITSRIDWTWMMNGGSSLTHGYTPESGMLPYRWIGYSEAMILYLLGLGVPSNPLPPSAWSAWTSGYSWQTYYGYPFVNFPPLFGHQYSHCWIDFRGRADAYMQGKGITYFENSRRATLANRAYCMENPGGFTGYSDSIWGLTACDGPAGYNARGAPPAQNDDGTIAPTAAGGSIPFTPTESMRALQAMYTLYGSQLWGRYGFGDAFNPGASWYGSEVIGIDQGPIIVMIENYRTGKVWATFMKNPIITAGLVAAGFQAVTEVAERKSSPPQQFTLDQNFPNPFNPTTIISYYIPVQAEVTVKVFNLLGQQVATLVKGRQEPGSHSLTFSAHGLSSGSYFYRLEAVPATGGGKAVVMTKQMVLIR